MNEREAPNNPEQKDIFIAEFNKLDNNDQLSLAIDEAIERMREYDEPITNTNIKNWIINLISERLNIRVPEDKEDPTRLQEYNIAERRLLENVVNLRRILPMQAKKTFGEEGSSFAEHSEPNN